MRANDLVRRAWLEWRVAKAFPRADDGEVSRPAPGPDRFPVDPPWWFRRSELGYGWGEAPSLELTLSTLARNNRLALLTLGTEAPKRVTYPKNFDRDPRSRRRRPR